MLFLSGRFTAPHRAKLARPVGFEPPTTLEEHQWQKHRPTWALSANPLCAAGACPEVALLRASGFGGTQVFSVRASALKRTGSHLRDFFSDAANVDTNCDAEGHYLVRRSWKHFARILEFLRDGSCELPEAYTPTTYDNRPASSGARPPPRRRPRRTRTGTCRGTRRGP